MRSWILVFLIASGLQGCGQNRTQESAYVHDTIQASEIDLKAAIKTASKSENIRSLLADRKGKRIVEEYFERFPSDSLEHVRSVTKSVMATLIGIAIDKRFIKGVDESMAKYIDEATDEYERITIKHLLTMTSGLEWDEGIGYNDNNEMKASKSQLNYMLNKPIVYEPGTKWNYSTGGTHLLSIILTRASGMSTLEFAQKYLFNPLGIQDIRWKQFSGGYYGGGSGLELKPSDMVRLGELFLHKGNYKGRQIVSKSYMEDATSIQQPPNDFFGDTSGYGYCFWISNETKAEGYAAQGYGGQTILVLPDYEMIIVTTYKWRVNGNQAGKQQDEAFSVVAYAIMKEFVDF